MQFPACVIPFGRAETSNEKETFDPKPGQIVPPCKICSRKSTLDFLN